ncbi:MAG TPA: phosphotransferase [Propionibacteriaceae bacterium]
MSEEILTGGNSTAVARVGDTVRRTAGPWTPTIQALLATLRAAGIEEVPEPLGLDEQGREVLSYRPGTVANYPLPAWVWTPQILTDVGRLLRRMHDATAGFAANDPIWQLAGHDPAEVICHNDVAPYNLVFDDDGVLTGIIDFDTASPGPRIWDLAYVAYRLVPYVGDAGELAPTEADRPGRLNLLLAAYGLPVDRAELLRTLVVRLHELAAWTDRRAADTGDPEFLDHAALYRRDAARLGG